MTCAFHKYKIHVTFPSKVRFANTGSKIIKVPLKNVSFHLYHNFLTDNSRRHGMVFALNDQSAHIQPVFICKKICSIYPLFQSMIQPLMLMMTPKMPARLASNLESISPGNFKPGLVLKMPTQNMLSAHSQLVIVTQTTIILLALLLQISTQFQAPMKIRCLVYLRWF